jgi:hypothetical protein
MALLQSPLGVQNDLEEPSSEAQLPKGLYIARTLVQDCWEVPVRVLNATHHNQKLTKGSPLVHCKPVILVTPPDAEQSQVQDTIQKLQDVTAGARQNLSDEIPRWKSSSPSSMPPLL